ncbi:MAG TPA: AraC family transcriptional regulator, partial [Anaerolineae bacterium]
MKDAIPTEKAKFWHDPQLENLELLRATYVTHAFTPHFHEGFAIGVIQAGVETFSYQKKQYFSTPGALVLINPGEIHTGQAAVEQGWTYRMIYPDASILQHAASEVAGRQRDVPFFPSPVVYDEAMARLMLNLHLALEDESTAILERQSLLLWTLGQLILRHADDRPVLHERLAERAAVQAARDYLDTHYAESVTLETLAMHVNLSPFHLLRVFKQELGLSPHTYLT